MLPTIFQKQVFEVRGKKIMIDRDVAVALGTETRYLNENAKLSPKWSEVRDNDTYRFQLNRDEANSLKSGYPTSNDFAKLPWVYTQRGCTLFAASLESVEACRLALDLVDVFVAYQNDHLQPKQLVGEIYADSKKILDAVMFAQKLLGATESTARAEAVLAVRREYPNIDYNRLLENNKSDVQERWGTPTHIGQRLVEKHGGKCSAQTANRLLTEANLQTPSTRSGVWVLSERALKENFGEYHSLGKKHSDGTPIQQIKWYLDRTVKEIEQLWIQKR